MTEEEYTFRLRILDILEKASGYLSRYHSSFLDRAMVKEIDAVSVKISRQILEKIRSEEPEPVAEDEDEAEIDWQRELDKLNKLKAQAVGAPPPPPPPPPPPRKSAKKKSSRKPAKRRVRAK